MTATLTRAEAETILRAELDRRAEANPADLALVRELVPSLAWTLTSSELVPRKLRNNSNGARWLRREDTMRALDVVTVVLGLLSVGKPIPGPMEPRP